MKRNHNKEIAEQLLMIRLSQMIVNEKYKNGDFKIPIHLALGHEAIAVSINAIMDENDVLVLHHRNIHYNLARAKALNQILNEYYLKEEGLAKGQLGSMNLANEAESIVYTSSILGNNLAVASGLALSKKIKGLQGLVIVTTGDGAIEEGSFYENLLFLKSNQLPALIVIENNEWSLATRIEERRCPVDIDKFAQSVDARYERLKGNDPFKYIERLIALKELALLNKTPVCVEVELTTLGSWYMDKEGYPNGKFINYHAGPAPTINLGEDPVIEESNEDPVYVLRTYFEETKFNEISNKALMLLKKEIK